MTAPTAPKARPRTPVISIRPDDAMAIKDIVRRLSAAWADNDADTLSLLYAEQATVALPGGDVYLKGRKEIRDWLAEAFETKWKGTHVLGMPLEIRYIRDDIIVMFSHGGAYLPGAAEVPVEHAIRGFWLFLKYDTGWIIDAYENTPVEATIAIPDETRMPIKNGKR